MKKLLTLIITAILCFGLTSSAFAALDADTVWEVRTTGADTNGGGFNSTNASAGTDYSQQDAAQLALTDLAMTTGGTTLTSATGGFTAEMEGNIIQIVSGTNFTAGFYEIVTYTDTNTVTLDRDATNGSNASSGVGNVGGGLASPQKLSVANVAGNTAYIESGTYQPLGANTYVFDLSVAGTQGSGAITWIGYTSTRQTAYGTDRPLMDANSVTNAAIVDQQYYVFKNIRFANSSSDLIYTGSVYITLINCKFSNSGDKALDGNSPSIYAVGTEFTGVSDVATGLQYGRIYKNCYAHDNTGSFGNGRGGIIVRCVSESNSNYGFNLGNSNEHNYLANNIAWNNTGASSDGFYIGGSNNLTIMLVENVSVSNGRYGFNWANNSGLIFSHNCYYGNGTAGLNNITTDENDVNADPLFTNAAAGDFTIGSSSPLIDAGMQPGTYTGLTGDYKWNIGVDQDDNASGGSSEHSYGFVN